MAENPRPCVGGASGGDRALRPADRRGQTGCKLGRKPRQCIDIDADALIRRRSRGRLQADVWRSGYGLHIFQRRRGIRRVELYRRIIGMLKTVPPGMRCDDSDGVSGGSLSGEWSRREKIAADADALSVAGQSAGDSGDHDHGRCHAWGLGTGCRARRHSHVC